MTNNRENTDIQRSRFYELIQVCITVPKDRFYEVMRTERDSYRYHNRFCSLEWSGIELAILLRKRLEELSQMSTDKKKSPVERLAAVLKAKFPYIPNDISFDFNGKTYTMPLFLYVLRHTFWRPRDVLLYYAKIIATSEDLRRKRIRVSAEAIRRAIKEATYEVIQSEFINEFSSTVINIREILSAFSNISQFVTYSEIGEILTKVDFRFAIGPEISLNRVDEKIEYLYQIGFLGIEVTPEMRDRFNIEHKHSFYFNEGLALLKTEGENKFRDYTFIIHPIFSEYLQLNTSDHELVLEFSWDYLREMDVLLSVSGNP